jgi:DNA polymerase-3 subunit delta
MSERFPAYLVRGDDAILLGDAVRDLVHELVGDGDLSLMVEDIGGDDSEATIAATVDAAQTPPFLTDHRVVVLREVGRFKTDDLTPLVTYLEAPNETTSLVLVGGGGQTSQKLTNAVKKVGHVVEAGVPRAKQAKDAWWADRLRAAPVRLDKQAAALVADHLGEDVGRLGALLELLEAVYGTGAHLSADDVAPHLGDAGAVAPWDLTDAIDAGRIGDAIDLVRRMVHGGRHPLQITATLHGHFSRLLRLDGAGLRDKKAAAQALGLDAKQEWRAERLLGQARRLGTERVGEAITLLARADLDLKGAREIPDDVVMEILVARLARLSPKR